MKRFFTLFLLGISGVIYSQTQANRTYLLIYEKQINADSLEQVFRQNRTMADERSRITLTLLKQLSESSGHAAEAFLNEKMADKAAPTIRYNKLWIVNALAVEAPAAFVAQLHNLPQVAYVEDITDLKAHHIAPVAMQDDAQTRAIGSVEPGLMAVGVRFLWNLGYTGKGLKLMSFDTGIWPEHPALGGRFYGEYMPLHLAWHGIFSPTPVDKSSSHGTHTIGTMSGLDTLTSDTIGLAFKAYSMSTDPIVSNLADTIGMANIMLAYQWVLNPDGDVNTTDDMPAVICNSWGTAGTPGFCNGFVSTMMQTIDLTGIANEYSAGNDGPGASTMGVPALINPGLVNTFSVGAVDGNTAGYPIASFSSRGPSTCASSGSLQIKPEVVAPGVHVRSCVRQNEYAYYDGTSMAGPHSAGLLLLLKEAFPTLPGVTLKEALYYSAIDLGAPGEDNIYGMGMINAEAAYNWLINEGYTPVSPVSTSPELMLEKEPTRFTNLVCASPVPNHTIYLYNEGSVAITDTVYFQVQLNGTEVGQWAQYINLAPQHRMQINHSLSLVPITGDNELWVSARQKNTPNEKDMINNNRTTHFVYYPSKSIPYTESFETDTLQSVQWTVINPDQAKTFETFTTAGQEAGTKSATMRFVFNTMPGDKDYMISPPVALNPTGNHKVAFDISYQKRTQTQKDTLLLLASLDCGATFNEVIYTGTANNDMVTFVATAPNNFIPTSASQWKRLTFDLPTAWNGQTVLFAFKSINYRGANAYLDDFSVFVDFDPLTVDEHVLSQVSVYPNPFMDKINIRLNAESEWVTLDLFDLSGRKVAGDTKNNVQSITWVPNELLPAGVYFLKIKAGNGQSVYKLVKQ